MADNAGFLITEKIVKRILTIVSVFILGSLNRVFGQVQRFPRPEFETDHVPPDPLTPAPRSDFMEYLDVFLLVLALSVATWLVLKKRNRRGVLIVSVLSLLYFGFVRKGCVCSIGAIQNVSLALFDPNYVIPITVIAFFIIPLVFTFFFGRTFCAAVCPLGAAQDLVLIKPVSISAPVRKVLGFLPDIYLGFAVLFAATASDFVICRYDPFVGIFRLDATFFMISLGIGFLLLSTFIGRPYCRFLCPYGTILGFISRFSKKHTTITPNACIQCRLCETSCAFDAINKPEEGADIEGKEKGIRQLLIQFLLIPAFVVAGGYAGYLLYPTFAEMNKTVRLAQEIHQGMEKGGVEKSLEIEAFQTAGQSVKQLYDEAAVVLNKYKTGSILLGIYLGLVFGIRLVRLSISKPRKDYEPDKATCFSCARCYKYCPVE